MSVFPSPPQAVEAEVAEILAKHAALRTDDGGALGWATRFETSDAARNWPKRKDFQSAEAAQRVAISTIYFDVRCNLFITILHCSELISAKFPQMWPEQVAPPTIRRSTR